MRDTDKTPNLPFLTFPKLDDMQRRQWVWFVDTTQSDFNLTNWSHIHVCTEHFTEHCVDEAVDAGTSESGEKIQCALAGTSESRHHRMRYQLHCTEALNNVPAGSIQFTRLTALGSMQCQ